MSETEMQNTESPDVQRLALRPKQAAVALGIGTRKLWELTNRGLVPHVRLDKAILYPVDGLREWLAKQSNGAGNKPAKRI